MNHEALKKSVAMISATFEKVSTDFDTLPILETINLYRELIFRTGENMMTSEQTASSESANMAWIESPVSMTEEQKLFFDLRD